MGIRVTSDMGLLVAPRNQLSKRPVASGQSTLIDWAFSLRHLDLFPKWLFQNLNLLTAPCGKSLFMRLLGAPKGTLTLNQLLHKCIRLPASHLNENKIKQMTFNSKFLVIMTWFTFISKAWNRMPMCFRHLQAFNYLKRHQCAAATVDGMQLKTTRKIRHSVMTLLGFLKKKCSFKIACHDGR